MLTLHSSSRLQSYPSSPVDNQPIATLTPSDFTQLGVTNKLNNIEIYPSEIVGTNDAGERVQINQILSSIPNLSTMSPQVFKDNYTIKVRQLTNPGNQSIDYCISSTVQGVGGGNSNSTPSITEFCNAARRGDLERVQWYIDNKYDVNGEARQPGRWGIMRHEPMTVLAHAIDGGSTACTNKKCVELLIKKGARPNDAMIAKYGVSTVNVPFHVQMYGGRAVFVQESSQYATNCTWLTPLQFACRYGYPGLDAKNVKWLLDLGFTKGRDEALLLNITPAYSHYDTFVDEFWPDRKQRVKRMSDIMSEQAIEMADRSSDLTDPEKKRLKSLLNSVCISSKIIDVYATRGNCTYPCDSPQARKLVATALSGEIIRLKDEPNDVTVKETFEKTINDLYDQHVTNSDGIDIKVPCPEFLL